MLVILTGPLLQRMPLSKKKCFWSWNILENLLILLLRDFTPSKTKTKTVLSLSTALYVRIILNQQCVVYEFQCNSCDSNYIGYTSHHLHLRIEEHKYSVIGKRLKDKHNQRSNNLHEQFTALKKCREVWVPYLWDAFNKERETDSEHSKWLHSSETVYFNFLHSFVYPASFILMHFPTLYPI